MKRSRCSAWLGLVTLGWIVGCSEGESRPGPESQGVSLLGTPLFSQVDTTGAIEAADAALSKDPEDVDLIIAAGRVRRNSWRYREAIGLYTKAIDLAPDDWRAYRFRGHRYLSLRQFQQAVADLEVARRQAPLNWDVAYHLGLAYFLQGRFADAADEYGRCLELSDDPEAEAAQSDLFRSCSQNRDDPESLVAMTEWAVRAAARAERDHDVNRLLSTIPDDLVIEENLAYYHTLLHYKGLIKASELLNPGPDAPYRRETVGFGVANWRLVNDELSGAYQLFRELAWDPWWPGFGRIAAEVEVHRMENQR